MSHKREPIRETCPDIDSAIAIMEKLRDANEALRDWGCEEAYQCDELKDEVSELKEEISELEIKLSNANNDIDELNNQIENLQMEIDEFKNK